jgi:hypothetical protein
MRHIHILAEGATEDVVIRDLLAPHLSAERQYVTYSVLGGVTRWAALRREIERLLRDSSMLLTTLIDYYAFPADAPGMKTRPTADALGQGVPR